MDDAQYVYVAGPYTHGEWGTNIRNAVEAAEELWQAGHVPFIPHTMTSLWSVLVEREGHTWLEYDYQWLLQCDALVRIEGRSEGSEKEIEFAREHDIDVYRGVEAFLDDC